MKLNKCQKKFFLKRLPKRFYDIINRGIADASWDDDGYWAYSHKGFIFRSMGCHTAHEETLSEFLQSVITLYENPNDKEPGF